MIDSNSHPYTKENELVWNDSCGITNFSGTGDGARDVEEVARSNFLTNKHDDYDNFDTGNMSENPFHPTNGGTMVILVDRNVSDSNPHAKAMETKSRVQEKISRPQEQGVLDKFRWQEELGEDEAHEELLDTDIDDLFLLAAASRGWIDELDIYERKGCPFLIKNQQSEKNDQKKSI